MVIDLNTDSVICDVFNSCNLFGIYICVDGKCVHGNESFLNMMQYDSVHEILFGSIDKLYARESLPGIKSTYDAILSDDPVIPHLFSVAVRRDGSPVNVILYNFKIEYFEKPAILTLVIDVGFDKNLRSSLPREDRCDSTEMLARGTAHEINNIVGTISGNLDMISMSLQEPSQAAIHIQQAADACRRAKDLARQLFRLVPRNADEPISVSIGSIVDAALQGVNPSIPAAVRIERNIGVPLCEDIIRANPTHVLDMLVDLFAYAIQAMVGTCGVLGVDLQEDDLDQSAASRLAPGLLRGKYLRLSIRHTGENIDLSQAARIFDPFFFTGSRGGAAGLVFAVAAATMRSLSGTIVLDTDRRKGCAFHLFFPRAATPVPHPPGV